MQEQLEKHVSFTVNSINNFYCVQIKASIFKLRITIYRCVPCAPAHNPYVILHHNDIGGNEGERETGKDVGDGLMIDAKWLTLDKESSNEERSGYIKNTENLSVYFFGCFLVCIFIIILDLKSPRPVRNIRSTLCQLLASHTGVVLTNLKCSQGFHNKGSSHSQIIINQCCFSCQSTTMPTSHVTRRVFR